MFIGTLIANVNLKQKRPTQVLLTIDYAIRFHNIFLLTVRNVEGSYCSKTKFQVMKFSQQSTN